MKKILVAAAIALFASQASAVISGSSHDLTGRAGAVAGKPSCGYCHAAHVFTASDIGANTYLWNRNVDSTVTAGVQTLTCLSCHDGVTSIFAVNNGTDGSNTQLTGNMNIGTDLSNDHPVATTYVEGGSASLVAVTTATGNGARLFGTNQIECASCHDVHAGQNYKFLFTGFQCTDCHNK